jgi:transcriptional regulator with XRE-family HTH domain
VSKRLLSKNPIPREHLRIAREMEGWSQRELAERVGTVQVSVSRWETGQTDPSPYYRRKLSQVLGKTPEDLDLEARGSSSSRVETMIFDPVIPPLLRLPLIGREHEIASLSARLCNETAVTLAISGLPGVGKTTLVCTLVQDPLIRASFPDGILWAGLGVRPDLQHHLVRWGTLLGRSVASLTALHDGHHEKDLVMAVRGAIGTRRMLLVIDDAWKMEDALPFQIGGPECATLITTRFPTLATALGGEILLLHELTSDQSLDLLSALAPQVVKDEAQ